MRKLILGSRSQGGRIVEDEWVDVPDAGSLAAIAPGANVVVPFALWQSFAAALHDRRGGLGVKISVSDPLQDLAPHLSCLRLIAIEFLQATDGRGFSSARLLRERFGFTGQLRAVGEVSRDQMFYLLRCGFDAFLLESEGELEGALSAYAEFSDSYQAAADQPLPLYRRRLVASHCKEPDHP